VNTARGVHGPGDDLPRPRDPAGVGDRDNRPEHGLARDARPVGAFTADQFAFDGRDAEPGGAGPVGDGLSNGPGADDDHVVRVLGRSAHVLSIRWARPRHIVRADNQIGASAFCGHDAD